MRPAMNTTTGCGGCAGRRTSIASAVSALVKGDVATAKSEAVFVAISSVADARTFAQSALRAARARLSR